MSSLQGLGSALTALTAYAQGHNVQLDANCDVGKLLNAPELAGHSKADLGEALRTLAPELTTKVAQFLKDFSSNGREAAVSSAVDRPNQHVGPLVVGDHRGPPPAPTDADVLASAAFKQHFQQAKGFFEKAERVATQAAADGTPRSILDRGPYGVHDSAKVGQSGQAVGDGGLRLLSGATVKSADDLRGLPQTVEVQAAAIFLNNRDKITEAGVSGGEAAGRGAATGAIVSAASGKKIREGILKDVKASGVAGTWPDNKQTMTEALATAAATQAATAALDAAKTFNVLAKNDPQASAVRDAILEATQGAAKKALAGLDLATVPQDKALETICEAALKAAAEAAAPLAIGTGQNAHHLSRIIEPDAFKSLAAKLGSPALWPPPTSPENKAIIAKNNLELHAFAQESAYQAWDATLRDLRANIGSSNDPKVAGDPRNTVIITAGPCGAGKGFCVENLLEASKGGPVGLYSCGAVADLDGEGNTESVSRFAELAMQLGFNVVLSYVDADDKGTFPNQIKRGADKGRTTNAEVAARSHVYGKENMKESYASPRWQNAMQDGKLKVRFIDNTKGHEFVMPKMLAVKGQTTEDPVTHKKTTWDRDQLPAWMTEPRKGEVELEEDAAKLEANYRQQLGEPGHAVRVQPAPGKFEDVVPTASMREAVLKHRTDPGMRSPVRDVDAAVQSQAGNSIHREEARLNRHI